MFVFIFILFLLLSPYWIYYLFIYLRYWMIKSKIPHESFSELKFWRENDRLRIYLSWVDQFLLNYKSCSYEYINRDYTMVVRYKGNLKEYDLAWLIAKGCIENRSLICRQQEIKSEMLSKNNDEYANFLNEFQKQFDESFKQQLLNS